jgi:cell division protein FtsL
MYYNVTVEIFTLDKKIQKYQKQETDLMNKNHDCEGRKEQILDTEDTYILKM